MLELDGEYVRLRDSWKRWVLSKPQGICLFVCLFVCLFIYLFICLYFRKVC